MEICCLTKISCYIKLLQYKGFTAGGLRETIENTRDVCFRFNQSYYTETERKDLHPVNIPCRRKPLYPEKPNTFDSTSYPGLLSTKR